MNQIQDITTPEFYVMAIKARLFDIMREVTSLTSEANQLERKLKDIEDHDSIRSQEQEAGLSTKAE